MNISIGKTSRFTTANGYGTVCCIILALMNRIKRILVIALILAVCSFSANLFGQSEEDDKKAASELAQQFSRRMQRTQDIGAIPKRFFSKRFVRETFEGSLIAMPFFDPAKPFPKTSERTRRRFVVAASNSLYFTYLYMDLIAKAPVDSEDYYSELESLPERIKFILRRDKCLSRLSSELKKGQEERPCTITNEKQLNQISAKLEAINVVFRDLMIQFSKIRFSEFLSELKVQKRMLGEPFRIEHQCYGDSWLGNSQETRFTLVAVPGFDFVYFVREAGQMKIRSVHQLNG